MQNDALKLLVALGYSLFVAFTSLEYFYLIPVMILLWFHRKECFTLLKKVVMLNFFILILVLFVAFENPTMAMELLIRINLILVFTVTLFFRSGGYDIIRGLDALHVSSVFIAVFYFTLIMIEFLRTEVKQMKTTLKARNFHAKTSLLTYQTFGNLFALMFIKAIKKSQELQYTMESRGFNGRIYLRTSSAVTGYDIMMVLLLLGMFMLKGLM